MSTNIGIKINALRKERGYTLDELAEKSKSSKSYIWELENKNPPRPSAEKLMKIAEALEVTLDYLTNEELPKEKAEDVRFYREYRKMDPETKKKIRTMVKMIWDKE